MSLDNDVERQGSQASMKSIHDGVETGSVHSRARAYSGHTWCDSFAEKGGNKSQQHDRSTSRDREYAPSISSRHLRFSVDSRGQDRNNVDSISSGRHSRGSARHQPERVATENGQIPQPEHEHSLPRLNCDDPGDWAVNHHLPNLISRLDEPATSEVRFNLNQLGTTIREMRYGNEAASTPLSASAPPSSSHGDGMRFRISFAEVQRMRILKALQDHDYMENRSKSIRDPFLVTGEYNVDNYILNCNIDSVLANEITTHAKSIRPWDMNPDESSEPITGTRGNNVAKTWYRGFKERIVIAAAGGAFLVGPMWIMVLNGGLYTSLISTTAFVTAFGVLMAYFLNEAKDVLASTAAYAAVLVVFVGTSNASTSTAGIS
ncbi:hypothetical protein CGCSCA1_v005701 [Colletotrichum siamense]|nr:hypothetical protein CGCSCA1_v005701 [Colletotrichum siamense]